MTDSADATPEFLHTPLLWRDDGWTARVIKNEDDDGWAVEMIKDGEPEPALVGPWTMGRDKRNPKPLDANAFRTLVKTAYEVRRRHEQHLHATLHKAITVSHNAMSIVVTLDIFPDEDSPHGLLKALPAIDPHGTPLGEAQVSAAFKLTESSAIAWIDGGYLRP